jgi:hypothetical protein
MTPRFLAEEPYYDEDTSKDSLELRELLLEDQPSDATAADSATPPLSPRRRRSTFWTRCRRRSLFERPRILGLLPEKCTPCRLIFRIVRFLLVFGLGSLATLYVFLSPV